MAEQIIKFSFVTVSFYFYSCYCRDGYKINVQMHPQIQSNNSAVNHNGDIKRGGGGCSSCNTVPTCMACHTCPSCSCKCHLRFKLHYRFMLIKEEELLVAEVKKIVEHNESFSSASSLTVNVTNGSPEHESPVLGMLGTPKGGLFSGKVSSLCTVKKWF